MSAVTLTVAPRRVETAGLEMEQIHSREAPLVRAGINRTTIISSFEVAYGHVDGWIMLWRALAQLAVARPECSCFRLLRSPDDDTHCAVLSEWDDVSSFHRFVRDMRLLWIERVAPGLALPATSTFLESSPERAAGFGCRGTSRRPPPAWLPVSLTEHQTQHQRGLQTEIAAHGRSHAAIADSERQRDC